MDLQQEWQNMSAEINTKNNDLHNISNLESNRSQELLNDVYFKLKWKLRWLRIIDIPILVAALIFRGDLQYVLIAVFLAYEITRYFMAKELNKIKGVIDYSLNTKQVLEENLAALTSILKIENLFGYIFIPISVPLGSLIYKLYRFETFGSAFNQFNFSHLIPFIVISVGLIFLAKKMNNLIFKQPIIDLKTKIKELAHQ